MARTTCGADAWTAALWDGGRGISEDESHWPPRCTSSLCRSLQENVEMPKQIGYAVVGAGDITRQVLQGFAGAADNSRVVAIVGGDRAHAQALAQEFRATAYHFDEFRQCLNRDDVQAVYVALPNSLHSDYTVD